jgi:rubrerythrin
MTVFQQPARAVIHPSTNREVSDMAVFDASDVMEVAIRIEENGTAFYRHAAGVVANEEVKAIFSRLADEEVRHREIFARFRDAMDPALPPEGYDGEYAAYLHSYVDNVLIFKTKGLELQLAEIRDEAAAFDFAIRRELDSILYYREIMDLLHPDRRTEIEKIVAEERRHYLILTDLKNRLAAP